MLTINFTLNPPFWEVVLLAFIVLVIFFGIWLWGFSCGLKNEVHDREEW